MRRVVGALHKATASGRALNRARTDWPYRDGTVGARRTSPLDQRVLDALLLTGRATADELASRLVSHRLGVLDSLRRLELRHVVRRIPTAPGRRAWGQPGAPGFWELAHAEGHVGLPGTTLTRPGAPA